MMLLLIKFFLYVTYSVQSQKILQYVIKLSNPVSIWWSYGKNLCEVGSFFIFLSFSLLLVLSIVGPNSNMKFRRFFFNHLIQEIFIFFSAFLYSFEFIPTILTFSSWGWCLPFPANKFWATCMLLASQSWKYY